jgi:hypothetical protein
MAAAADAGRGGTLRVDEELHLAPLAAEEEDPEVANLRTALDRRIGEAQLPELLLEVDANVRFSWIMLGREPRSDQELLMVYAGILAHGTSMSAAQTTRMMPQLWAATVRQAMRWAGAVGAGINEAACEFLKAVYGPFDAQKIESDVHHAAHCSGCYRATASS